MDEGSGGVAPKRGSLRIWLALLLLATTVGCSAEPEHENEVHVRMYDNAFSPPLLRVPENTRVVFVNAGRNPHNAVASDASWSTEEDFGDLVMPAGTRAMVEFGEAGVNPYYCTFHGTPNGIGMAGVIVVGDVEYQPTGRGEVEPVSEPTGTTRRVPGGYPTIQAAVDAASPGDLVLVAAGVYREEVTVTTPSLVLRGVDRNRVILDGEFVRGNGVMALADGVAIENMTARNYLLNGFFWTGVTGFRGSYLTAYNNGDYGIYAFDSTDGLFEHSYASGSPDSGFYVGQCRPCRVVLRNLLAENNALGYSGTNASGELYITSSVWRRNMVGIVPNTLDSELLPPQRGATVVANLVYDNNNRLAPTHPSMASLLGNGIVVIGGAENTLERNVVADHEGHGILITPMVHENVWLATGNRVRHNQVVRSGRADLGLAGPASFDNCFEGNDHETSAPAGLEIFQGCRGLRLPLGFDLVQSAALLLRARSAGQGDHPGGDIRDQPVPPDQAQLPGGVAAPVRPAAAVFDGLGFDLAAALPPPEAESVLAASATGVERAGSLARLSDAWAYWMWLALGPIWLAVALWDLARRSGPGAVRAGWALVSLALPYLGPAAYLLAGRPVLARGPRWLLVGGATLAYLLLLTTHALCLAEF